MRHKSTKDSGCFQDLSCFETDGRTTTFRSKTLTDQAMCFSVWGSHSPIIQTHFVERHLDRQAGRSASGNAPLKIPSPANSMSKNIHLLIAVTCVQSFVACRHSQSRQSEGLTVHYRPAKPNKAKVCIRALTLAILAGSSQHDLEPITREITHSEL